MKYVNVVVATPDGFEYDAEVDSNADDPTLISDLVRELRLPRFNDDGSTPISYGINLIGATRIKEGVTLQLYEIPQASVKSLRLRK